MQKLDFNTKIQTDFNDTTKANLLQILHDEIEFKDFTTAQKIVFSKFYLVIAVVTYIFTGWLMMQLRANIWKRYNLEDTSKLTPESIYKHIFESNYTNIKIGEVAKIDLNFLKANRGNDVPRDAIIYDYSFGQTFILDAIRLKTAWVNWEWKRSNGKSTQVYYRQKIYLFSDQINPLFKNLELEFKKGNIFSHKGKALENADFNREFWYEYNNPVKGRIFFPLSAQERWVDVAKNQKAKYNQLNSFKISLKNNQYLFSRNALYKSRFGFIICQKVVNNKADFIEGVFLNILADVQEITSALRLVSINQYFFKA